MLKTIAFNSLPWKSSASGQMRPVRCEILPERNLKQKIRDGMFWAALSKGLAQLLSWIVTIVVARLLSPDDYGLMGMAGSYMAFLILFNECGLGAAIVQKKDISREDLNDIFWIVFLVNMFFFAVSVLCAPAIASFFNEPRLTNVIRVSSSSFVIYSISLISYHMLTKAMTFNKRAMAECTGNAVGAMTTLFCAMQGLGVWSLVFGTLGLEVTKHAMYCVYYPWMPQLRFSPKRISGLMSFGAKVAVGRVFWYASNNSDLLIAGKVLGKGALGYYSMALQLASVPLDKLVSIIAQVAFPAFSHLQNDDKLLREYLFRFIRGVSFVTWPMFFGLLIVSDLAVPLLLTDKWLPIVFPLKILCVVSAFKAISAMYGPLLLAKNRPELVGVNNAIMAVVLLASFTVGVSYGLDGLAYSWLVYPIIFGITTHVCLSTIGATMSDLLREIKHSVLATLLMVCMTLSAQQVFSNMAASINLATSIVVGIIAYGAYFFFFDRRVYEESKAIIVHRK